MKPITESSTLVTLTPNKQPECKITHHPNALNKQIQRGYTKMTQGSLICLYPSSFLLQFTVTMAAQNKGNMKKKNRNEKSILQVVIRPSGRESLGAGEGAVHKQSQNTNLMTAVSPSPEAKICHRWKSTSHMTTKLIKLIRSHHLIVSTSRYIKSHSALYSLRASVSPSGHFLNFLLNLFILMLTADHAVLKVRFIATLANPQ